MPFTIRARTPDDAAVLEGLARVVYERDGYPVVLPDDLRAFIVAPDAMGAWVAVDGGDVAGHVALHQRGSDEVMALASNGLGESWERLALVARLFVSPSSRRAGVAAGLLATATAAARSADRVPVLDVAVQYGPAIRLYEALGWARLGRVTVDIGAPELVDEYVFAAPLESRGPACPSAG